MKSKKSIKSILIMAILGIISLFFINRSLAANTAKISVETANLREEANSNSKILELLSLNDEVEVLEKSGDWYKVKVKGITGYLRNDLIKVNEEQAQNQTETTSSEKTNTENSELVKNENTDQEQTVEKASDFEKKEDNQEIKLGKQTIAEDTKLKIVPAINATDIIEVKKNEEVEVTDIINGWVCIETQVTKGWIRQERIKKEETVESNQEKEQEQDKEENKQEQNEKKEEQQTQNVEQENESNTDTVIKTLYVNSSSVNMRKGASTSSEVVTTVSLNTSVDVYEEANGWSKVKVDGKEGYISSSLLSTTKRETSRSLETPRREESVSDNSSNEGNTNTETESNTASSSKGNSSVVDTAMSYIGSKYVYGGSTPSGFDCSGFTSYIYKQYGVNLNRTAAGQYSNGTAVSRDDLQAGDLVMFGKSGINHVGIYIGNGQIVHAANPSRGVTTDTINSGYYNNNYVGARRVM